MKSGSVFSAPHFIVIGAGAVIFVALFFAERTPPLDNKKPVAAAERQPAAGTSPAGSGSPSGVPFSIKDLLPLTPEQKELAAILEKTSEAQTGADSAAAARKLVIQALKSGRYDYAAVWQEILFRLRPSDTALKSAAVYARQAKDLFMAENRKELSEKARLKAVSLYEEYLKKRTDDTDAKIDLALLHVDSAQPMTGIQQLKAVADANPGNYRAQLELGIFSLNTAQLNKAEERFQTVIKLQPDRWEGYYYLGLTFRQAQKNPQAKEAFAKAEKRAKDRIILDEIATQLKGL